MTPEPAIALGASPIRPTVAEVDLRRLANNLRKVRQIVGLRVGIMPVIKADAYGHGIVPVARLLEGLGVWGFAVAIVEEGVALRQAGIRVPILVMGAAFGVDHGEVIDHGLVPVVGDPGDVQRFAEAARRAGKPRFGIHVKIDTGMSRLGVTEAAFADFVVHCAQHPAIRVDGLATHLSRAEEADEAPTRTQLAAFGRCLDRARALGADPQVIHAANSAAALRFAESRFDVVRPGLALYGIVPSAHVPDPGFEPVTSWRTRINAIREVPEGTPVSYGGSFVTQRPSRIATIPVGYADGYPRRLSNRAAVQVTDGAGRALRVPLVGRVCMDLCMIDVTDAHAVAVGDQVTLIGGEGPTAIRVDEVAGWAETISYEVLVGISKRVPRVYPGLDSAELGFTLRA